MSARGGGSLFFYALSCNSRRQNRREARHYRGIAQILFLDARVSVQGANYLDFE